MKKNYIILIGLVTLLCAAVFINSRINTSKSMEDYASVYDGESLSAENKDEVFAVESEEYFEVFRTDRENVREEELTYLETIISHEQTDSETFNDAQQQKLAIIDSMEKEFTIESLLKSKGFTDAAVTFHKGSVNVIVKADALSDAQVAQIFDIVIRETGEEAKNIKLSLAKSV